MGFFYQMHKLGERTMASMTDSNWNELMTPLWALGIFPLFHAIWSEHGINDPLCQNWALGAFVLTDLSWNEPLLALETACWCRFAQQKNLFLPTASLTAFAISRSFLRPNIWQISRGPLFVQISGKYLEGLSSPKYLANISRAFVFGFQRLHRLLHLMKFDARTMLSNCTLCCNPEGQLGLQLYPEKKTTLLCSCAEHFFLIFLNTELATRIQEPYVCIYVLYTLVRR